MELGVSLSCACRAGSLQSGVHCHSRGLLQTVLLEEWGWGGFLPWSREVPSCHLGRAAVGQPHFSLHPGLALLGLPLPLHAVSSRDGWSLTPALLPRLPLREPKACCFPSPEVSAQM